MDNQLKVTIVFNGKEITTNLDATNIESVEQAEAKAQEAIDTFIARYKLNAVMAEQVQTQSYWNKDSFKVLGEAERYGQTHSKEAYQVFKAYLDQSGMEKKEAVRMAKEILTNYYNLILSLEYEGYSREEATQIVEASPRREERLQFSLMVLGDKAYPKEVQEIATLKGFYQ